MFPRFPLLSSCFVIIAHLTLQQVVNSVTCNYGQIWGPVAVEDSCNYIASDSSAVSYKFECVSGATRQNVSVYNGKTCNESEYIGSGNIGNNSQSIRWDCSLGSTSCDYYYTLIDYYGDSSSDCSGDVDLQYTIVIADSMDGLCAADTVLYEFFDDDIIPATVTSYDDDGCTGDINWKLNVTEGCQQMDTFGGGYGYLTLTIVDGSGSDSGGGSDSGNIINTNMGLIITITIGFILILL